MYDEWMMYILYLERHGFIIKIQYEEIIPWIWDILSTLSVKATNGGLLPNTTAYGNETDLLLTVLKNLVDTQGWP